MNSASTRKTGRDEVAGDKSAAPPRPRKPVAAKKRTARGKAPQEKTVVVRDPARERILQKALELFAARGFDGVTVRDLAQSANVNLAAINYYFGSKEGLLLVLARREAKTLVEQRLAMLQTALNQDVSRQLRLERVVRALIEPVVRWCLQPGVGSLYVPTMIRAGTRSQPELQAMMERESVDLQPFTEALQTLSPQLLKEDIYWQLHFLLGLEHSLLSDLPRLQHLSGGLCDTGDLDRIIDRTVAFAVRGLTE